MTKKVIGVLVLILTITVSCRESSVTYKFLGAYDIALIKAEPKTKSQGSDNFASYEDSVKAIFNGDKFAATYTRDGKVERMDLHEYEIDKVNMGFYLQGLWIVNQQANNTWHGLGVLSQCEELVFLRGKTEVNKILFDTVAYIPRKQLIENGNKLRDAYSKNDVDACRFILHSNYSFKPIDAKGYEALKAAGLN
ncbi:MAG: hypothetical protein ACRCX1_07985 [Bacteroidales bacterium]